MYCPDAPSPRRNGLFGWIFPLVGGLFSPQLFSPQLLDVTTLVAGFVLLVVVM
jgi:hypothetical protein